jgi:hypothetical protein
VNPKTDITWDDDERFAHTMAALNEGLCPRCNNRLTPCIGHSFPMDPRFVAVGDCLSCCSCFGGVPPEVDVSDLREPG